MPEVQALYILYIFKQHSHPSLRGVDRNGNKGTAENHTQTTTAAMIVEFTFKSNRKGR